MSVSSVGSSSPNPYLQRLLSPDDADPSDAAAPSDPLQALYQAVTGGQSSDPLVAAAASSSDGLSASCGAPQFSPDVMKALSEQRMIGSPAELGLATDQTSMTVVEQQSCAILGANGRR